MRPPTDGSSVESALQRHTSADISRAYVLVNVPTYISWQTFCALTYRSLYFVTFSNSWLTDLAERSRSCTHFRGTIRQYPFSKVGSFKLMSSPYENSVTLFVVDDFDGLKMVGYSPALGFFCTYKDGVVAACLFVNHVKPSVPIELCFFHGDGYYEYARFDIVVLDGFFLL